MASDYEDFYHIDSLTDGELEALIREELTEYPDLDARGIDLRVANGQTMLSGRIGTEAELQLIEHVITDVLGLTRVDNQLVVDELRREEQDEAADVANARVYAPGRGGRGGADRTEDSAEHLLDDTAAEQFGTDDMREAAERGYSYNPPNTPIQEGTWNREEH